MIESISFNKKHAYYFQVQGQLNILKKKFCYFAVWTSKFDDLKVELIERDLQIKQFLFGKLVPHNPLLKINKNNIFFYLFIYIEFSSTAKIHYTLLYICFFMQMVKNLRVRKVSERYVSCKECFNSYGSCWCCSFNSKPNFNDASWTNGCKSESWISWTLVSNSYGSRWCCSSGISQILMPPQGQINKISRNLSIDDAIFIIIISSQPPLAAGIEIIGGLWSG